MFRALAISALLLASCEAKSDAPARVVTAMPELPQEFVSKLAAYCTWKTANIAVFENDTQRLKFRYQSCPNKELVKASLYPGYIALHIKYDGTALDGTPIESIPYPMFKVAKTAPHTPQEYMEKKISRPQRLKPGVCEVLEIFPNVWVKQNNAFQAYPQFVEDPNTDIQTSLKQNKAHNKKYEKQRMANQFCGRELKMHYIFSGEIVIEVPHPELSKTIDFSSITYEDRS